MAYFQISANDTDMGEYHADSAEQALNAYARDAGYKDYADAAAQFGDDAEAHQIDTDALRNSVTQATGHNVFQDSYGNGVALVDGESYATHKDLADSIGRHIAEFFA